MKLYHFTSGVFLPRIKIEGLTKGIFPMWIDGGLQLHPNVQWLTKKKGFDQTFHDPEMTRLPYDRLEYRLTVSIPKSYRSNLLPWEDVERKYKQFFLPDFDYGQDCEHWVIFIGQIKPNWFRQIVKKEELVNA